MTRDDIEHWFAYTSPTEEDKTRYQTIRYAAKDFALVILENTPEGADQTAALRKVREAMLTANAAIACDWIVL